MVEHATENRGVASSILALAINTHGSCLYVLTLAVLAEVAVALPAALVAVTATRTGCPLSERVSV